MTSVVECNLESHGIIHTSVEAKHSCPKACTMSWGSVLSIPQMTYCLNTR